MSTDNKGQPPPKGRRNVSVDGAPARPEEKKRAKLEPRSLKDILGEEKKGGDAEGEKPAGPGWNPIRLEQFMRGQITLGDLEGITKQEQYEMAKIGFSYLTSGKLAQAKTVFEGLLALDPFDSYFHTALGSIAQQENRLEEAESRYTRALEINPFSPVALANRGEVRIGLGKLGEGAQDLARALEEDPNATQPSTLRARATIQVVREQLTSLNLGDAAGHKTGPKVPVVAAKPDAKAQAKPEAKAQAKPDAKAQADAKGQTKAAAPRAHPRGARPGPRPGPRKK